MIVLRRLLRPLAWWWCAANFSADWLLNLAQVFGLPFRWANYDPTAPQETVDRICSMLQNMGSAGWAAFPAWTTIKLKEAGDGGDHSPQGELLDRADRYARLLLLGQMQSGGKGSAVGGQVFGTVESDVKADRIDAAGRYACRVLNTQLLPSILALNYGRFGKSGQHESRRPRRVHFAADKGGGAGGGEIPETRIDAHPALERRLGLKPGKIFADCAALARKHPSIFTTAALAGENTFEAARRVSRHASGGSGTNTRANVDGQPSGGSRGD